MATSYRPSVTIAPRALLILLGMAAGLLPLAAAAEPRPFAATYRADFKGLPVTARANRRLEQLDDGSFRLTSEALSFLATITETTRLRWDGDRIRPYEYQYRRKGLGRNRDVALTFDWERGRVGGGEHGEIDLPAEALDKLGYQLQLRHDLKGIAGGVEVGQRFTYAVADDDRIRSYTFEVQGEELTDTAVGPLRTLRVARIRNNSRRDTLFWLAQEWDYLLVRLRQTEKGSGSFDLVLESGEIDGRPVTGISDPSANP